MSPKLNRVALTALLMVALPSWASDLPTSENPAKGKWRVMKPTSFTADMTSVLAQCNRAAQASSTDRLTTDMCQQLPALIQGGKCQKVDQVPDGIVFDLMNGHESGMSRVTKSVEKTLGRTDKALVCDLGNRTYAYWFTGDKGKSCNNIGVVFTAPPPVPAPPPSPPAPKPADPLPPPPKVTAAPPKKCEVVLRRYIVPQQGQVIYVPGLSVAVCRGHVAIPDLFVNIPGDVMTVTREEQVCN